METGNANHAIHLIDLAADHYFGERQESGMLRLHIYAASILHFTVVILAREVRMVCAAC